MKFQNKAPFIVVATVAALSLAVLVLIDAAPAQASGGWGFGMAYGPSVVASCSSYNLVPARVDVPANYYAGYVTGRLINPRTGTSKQPVFGIDTVNNAGSPTLTYVIFNPPTGTIDGDILQVELTLSAIPYGPPVNSFGFSYNCSTGQVIQLPSVQALNQGYGDTYVAVVSGQDAQGNPDVEVWCLDPQGLASFINMTLTKQSLAAFPAYPSTNTLVDRNNSCTIPVAAYVLTTGEYNVTFGPDQNGVVYQTIFTGLPPTNVYSKSYNINQLSTLAQ